MTKIVDAGKPAEFKAGEFIIQEVIIGKMGKKYIYRVKKEMRFIYWRMGKHTQQRF